MEVFQAVTQFVSHLIGLIGFVIAWAAVLLAGECHDRPRELEEKVNRLDRLSE